MMGDVHPGSGSRIWIWIFYHPGSSGQKGTGSRILNAVSNRLETNRQSPNFRDSIDVSTRKHREGEKWLRRL
jgi:hypothetical protein